MIAFRLASDILNDNEYAQAGYRMESAQWLSCMETHVQKPFQIPAQIGWSISGHDAQHLTRITKHTTVSFICLDCGYYGPDWGEIDCKWWFRCYHGGGQ